MKSLIKKSVILAALVLPTLSAHADCFLKVSIGNDVLLANPFPKGALEAQGWHYSARYRVNADVIVEDTSETETKKISRLFHLGNQFSVETTQNASLTLNSKTIPLTASTKEVREGIEWQGSGWVSREPEHYGKETQRTSEISSKLMAEILKNLGKCE